MFHKAPKRGESFTYRFSPTPTLKPGSGFSSSDLAKPTPDLGIEFTSKLAPIKLLVES